jgi:hypothetical protein
MLIYEALSSANSGQKLGAMRRLGVRNDYFSSSHINCKDIYTFIEIL